MVEPVLRSSNCHNAVCLRPGGSQNEPTKLTDVLTLNAWPFCGDLMFVATCTSTVLVVVLPDESVQVTVMVEMQVTPPLNSARSCTWWASTNCQSGEVSPSPPPSTGWLLVMFVMLQFTPPHVSVDE